MNDRIQMTLKWLGREKRCYVCGKAFLGSEEDWAYKRTKAGTGHPLYFCSWKHLREYDQSHVKKRGRKRTPYEAEIYRRLAGGERPTEIARELGITKGTVWYYYDRWNEAKEDSE